MYKHHPLPSLSLRVSCHLACCSCPAQPPPRGRLGPYGACLKVGGLRRGEAEARWLSLSLSDWQHTQLTSQVPAVSRGWVQGLPTPPPISLDLPVGDQPHVDVDRMVGANSGVCWWLWPSGVPSANAREKGHSFVTQIRRGEAFAWDLQLQALGPQSFKSRDKWTILAASGGWDGPGLCLTVPR